MKEKVGAADPEVLNDLNGSDDAIDAGTAVIQRPVFGVGKPQEQVFTGTISFPYLQIAHGVGGLATEGFSPGELVLGKEHALYSPARKKGDTSTPKLKLIVMSFTEYFKQYLTKEEFENNERPQVFATPKEAKDAGFTVDWDPITSRPPTAPRAMTWLMLIEQPEGLECELFCLDANDKIYAPAYMSLDKSAYLSVKDKFGMACFSLKGRGINSVEWEMGTKIKTAKTGNTTWVPDLKLSRHMLDDEIEAVVASFTG